MCLNTNIVPELPSIVRPLNNSSLAIYRCSTILAGLFAVAEVHLLSFVKNESNYKRSTGDPMKHALLITIYSGVFSCLSAVISGLILTVEFGERSLKGVPIQQGTSTLDLRQCYGANQSESWILVTRYWLFSLVAGAISLFTQVLLCVWLEESNPVKFILLFIALFTLLPLLHFLPRGPTGSLMSSDKRWH